jgi:hypothetical protein
MRSGGQDSTPLRVPLIRRCGVQGALVCLGEQVAEFVYRKPGMFYQRPKYSNTELFVLRDGEVDRQAFLREDCMATIDNLLDGSFLELI